jgi:hypothetical protein
MDTFNDRVALVYQAFSMRKGGQKPTSAQVLDLDRIAVGEGAQRVRQRRWEESASWRLQ